MKKANKLVAFLLMISLILSCAPLQGVVVAANSWDTSIGEMTVNYRSNPLGIDEKDVRFSWKMESNLIGQGQSSYQIKVFKGSADGTLVWESEVVESGSSTGIAYEGPALELETRYFWNVSVVDVYEETHISEYAYFETGTNWNGATWIMPTKSTENDAYKLAGNTYDATAEDQANEPVSGGNYNRRGGNPLIRTEAVLTRNDVSSAKLYITGLGNYSAYINGEKVMIIDDEGNETEPMLGPGWTDFRIYTNYQTYDVTQYIDGNQIVLGAEMHKGPYAGRVGNAGSHHQILGTDYGSTSSARTLALLAKLVITYEDGSQQVIGTNPDSWKSIAGPVTFNDYFNGEIYNANRAQELAGWNDVGFNDSGWFQVDEIAEDVYPISNLRPNNSAVARIAEEYTLDAVSGFKFKPSENLTAEEAGIANTRGAVVPHDVDVSQPITLEYGEILSIDLGQNMVGVLEMDFSGQKDTVVKVRHAEMLNDGSTTSDAARGTLYYGAMRGADGQTSYYTMSDEGRQVWSPSTTYNGFQHVEISVETEGESITLYGVKGKVITSVNNETGAIETSDASVNQLISNVFWGQMGNFTTIPTDCPQRTERVGWTGDAQLFAQSAIYNYDSIPFYDNYIQIMDANNQYYGNDTYGAVMPRGFGNQYNELNAGWGDAGVVIPWTLYLQTGDTYQIKRSYETMDRYMDKVYGSGPNAETVNNTVSRDSNGAISMQVQRFNQYGSTGYYGDWLAFSAAHLHYMNAVYQIYDTVLMQKMAEAAGLEDMVEKYQERYEELKAVFLSEPIMETVPVYNGTSGQSGNNPLGKVRTGGGFVYGPTTAAEYGMEDGDLMSYGPVFNGYILAYQDNAQTALLWALKLELYRDEEHRQHLIDKLVENIKNEGGEIRPGQPEDSLAVGFLGVNVLLPVVTDIGAPDVAYDLLLQDEIPSWLGTVKNGATTMWERWDSYSKDKGFGSAGMNSFNHFSYGACIEWMYEYMVGIDQVESTPGFKEITLQPTIDTSGRIDYVDGSYNSLYGKIKSSWTADGSSLSTYSTVVPANTTANLYLPVTEDVAEGFVDIDGVKYESMEEHNGMMTAKFTLSSGGYDFSIENGALVAELQDGYVTYVDKSELQALYDEYKDLDESGYTEATWAEFEKALEGAKAMLDGDDATQEEVDVALDNLQKAIDALMEAANKGELMDLYDDYKDLDESGYTEATWAEFEKALEDAKAVLDNGNATQEEVDGALDNLQNAIDALKEAVDKSELQGLYDEYKDLHESGYTEATWAEFEKALEDAKAVLDNDSATQEGVDAALTALRQAYNSLVKEVETTYTVTGSATTGGSVSPETKAVKGKDAEIEVKANEGFKLAALLVDGVTVDLKDVEDGVYTIENIQKNMVVRALFVSDQSNDFAAKFTDVPKTTKGNPTWYYKAVDMLTGLNIIEGTTATAYEPDRNVKRSEFTKLLFELALNLGIEPEQVSDIPFTDMPGANYWAKGYIGWAYESGIVEGHDATRFGPEENIRRQDMALMLQRFFEEYLEYELPGDATANFTDRTQIDAYARGAVEYVVRTGLMQGHDTGAFDPKGSTLRNQAAQVLYNYLIYTD